MVQNATTTRKFLPSSAPPPRRGEGSCKTEQEETEATESGEIRVWTLCANGNGHCEFRKYVLSNIERTIAQGGILPNRLRCQTIVLFAI